MNAFSRLINAAAITAAAAASAVPASAADSSPWTQDSQAAIRLIAGTNQKGADTFRAGIEIQVAPGWHTYWRYPGDAGVPPRFDFSGSQNLAAARVSYPAPRLIADEVSNSIGYERNVIFPVLVTPDRKDKPVKLHVVVDYAICEKLCVPAKGSAELTLTPGTSANDKALAEAEAQVPRPASATEAGLSVKRVPAENGKMVHVLADVATPAGKRVALFAEGPTAEWALPVPKPVDGAPAGHQRFSFELDGLPPGVDVSGRIPLVLTLVKGAQSFEVKTLLD
jgi:DsbC/DsbD-like thiol-disulfide interchange protein